MRTFKAGYTIEASIITSIVLFLTSFIIYITFLTYDKVRISYVLKETLLLGKTRVLAGESITGAELTAMASQMQGDTIVLKGIQYIGEVGGEKLRISCTGSSGVFSSAASVFHISDQTKSWHINAEITVRKPENVLRLYSILSEETGRWRSDTEEN